MQRASDTLLLKCWPFARRDEADGKWLADEAPAVHESYIAAPDAAATRFAELLTQTCLCEVPFNPSEPSSALLGCRRPNAVLTLPPSCPRPAR